MRSRPFILFWGAAAAAVFFLGAVWATAGRLGSSDARPIDIVVLLVALGGLGITLTIAGRIAFVLSRQQQIGRDAQQRGGSTGGGEGVGS